MMQSNAGYAVALTRDRLVQCREKETQGFSPGTCTPGEPGSEGRGHLGA